MLTGLLLSAKKIFPVLLAIFFAVFFLIILTRIVFAILIHKARKTYNLLLKKKKNLHQKIKKFKKEDEELLRKKNEFLSKIPRANSELKAEARAQNAKRAKQNPVSGSYELVESEDQQLEREEKNKVQIVDIVKPIGFWTSMILGQKLTYLIQSAQIINKRENKGFWASMIEAQERASGRQRGRGR